MADKRKSSGLLVPAAVVAFCATLFGLVVVLAAGNDSSGDSATAGFGITLLVVVVAGTLLALVWRAVSRRRRG